MIAIINITILLSCIFAASSGVIVLSWLGVMCMEAWRHRKSTHNAYKRIEVITKMMRDLDDRLYVIEKRTLGIFK